MNNNKFFLTLFLCCHVVFLSAIDIAEYQKNRSEKICEGLNSPKFNSNTYAIDPQKIWKILVNNGIKIKSFSSVFSDKHISLMRGKDPICDIDIDFAESDQDALTNICNMLSFSSMSDEAIIKSYKIWKGNIGIFCLVNAWFNEEEKTFDRNKSRIIFFRNGIIVSVVSIGSPCNIYEIASEIDTQIIKVINDIKDNKIRTSAI